jgi:hypothetical protein
MARRYIGRAQRGLLDLDSLDIGYRLVVAEVGGGR